MKRELNSIGNGVIKADESQKFAMISGDFNPLHLDVVSARRYQFGSTLIHGINGTLRALDAFFSTQKQPASLSTLQVLFSAPVQQGDELEYRIEQETSSSARIQILSGGKKAQTIEVSFVPGGSLESAVKPSSIEKHHQIPVPADITLEQAETFKGSTALTWNPNLFSELFPQLAAKIPESQCATILGTTNIVGMICPGLNSVYARLNLVFDPDCSGSTDQLDYSVESTDPRFARVVIAVSNAAANGEIEAFFRPAPASQASFSDIKPLVQKDAFSSQHALIVGGSRGLGEVTAKLLAAGGATTRITFANGEQDATQVAREICDGGGACKAIKFDIQSGELPEDLLTGPGQPTHIYYMVSPLIKKNDSSLWDADLFNTYADFYIRGLADLLTPITRSADYRKQALSIYLPSTVFLDSPEKGFSEYIAAKAAAESFTAQLAKRYPKWNLYAPRLPRMLTDQTSGISGLDTLDNARNILASLPED